MDKSDHVMVLVMFNKTVMVMTVMLMVVMSTTMIKGVSRTNPVSAPFNYYDTESIVKLARANYSRAPLSVSRRQYLCTNKTVARTLANTL